VTAVATKPSTRYAAQALSVSDLIATGSFNEAVERMRDLCRIQDPEAPVDVDAIRARYEATRSHLKAVVPPEPFRIVVERVGGTR
jgi:hypothetical protein